MTHNYNFTDKCPTVFDFEVYLKETGSIEFNTDFKLHLNTCELCNQSVQGYKATGLTYIADTLKSTSKTFESNSNQSKRLSLKFIGYAASIILLIGFSAIYYSSIHKSTKKLSNNFDYSYILESPSTKNKIIAKKPNDNYIYIGTCNKIAYNDQFLSSQELLEKLKNQKHINLITVEVAAGNYECATEIINSIKLENVAPIITISNSRGIKKLTPWGGGLGG